MMGTTHPELDPKLKRISLSGMEWWMDWQGHLVNPFSWMALGWQEIPLVPGLAGRSPYHTICKCIKLGCFGLKVERGETKWGLVALP